MMVWVASGGEALPLFHRDTVGRDTLTMFATSEPLSPPRCSRSSKIRATALSITTGTPTCCIHVSQEVLNETELYLPIVPCARSMLYILNTPNCDAGGIPAFNDAAIPSASVWRVSSGSITPSSHKRALA